MSEDWDYNDSSDERSAQVLDPRHGLIMVTEHVKFLVEKDKREWCPQRTEPWYEKRKKHLTASAFATAVGKNPYESRCQAIEKKVGLAPGFKGNAATAHGNKYEQEAIELYEKKWDKKVLEFGLLESMNEGEDFLAGSPDGITADGILIEVKCPLRRKPNGSVPGHYMFQVQGLLRMLRIREAHFIEYIPEGNWRAGEFHVVPVTVDPVFWKEVFPKMQSFWEEVLRFRKNIQDKENFIQEYEAEKERRRKRRLVLMKDSDGEDSDSNDSLSNSNRERPETKKRHLTVVTISSCDIEIPEEEENGGGAWVLTKEMVGEIQSINDQD